MTRVRRSMIKDLPRRRLVRDGADRRAAPGVYRTRAVEADRGLCGKRMRYGYRGAGALRPCRTNGIMSQMEEMPSLLSTANPSRAWFGSSISDFLRMDSDTVLGRLATHSDFAVLPAQ